MEAVASGESAGRPSRRRIVVLVASVLLGVVLAAGAIFGVVARRFDRVMIYNQAGWMTARDIGSRETDPLTKAFIAKVGLFANSKHEAIYLQAFEGDPLTLWGILAGQPVRRLSGGVHYRLVGAANIPSAWWSVTLYGADEFLFPNADRRYGFRNDQISYEEDGSFAIDVAEHRPPDAKNWIPTSAEGPISLTLRLYQPDREVYDAIERYPLPRVRRVDGP